MMSEILHCYYKDKANSEVVVSSSPDCEAVYTGRIQGLQRFWEEKFSVVHLHFAVMAHKMESMVRKIH